jgi:F-type H+-transporting ATPase subunit epsilon
MQVTVISPEQAVFEGAADGVVVPAYDGEVGILARHAPMMLLLGEGNLKIRQAEASHVFRVRGGFLQVTNDAVRVVAEYAEGTR